MKMTATVELVDGSWHYHFAMDSVRTSEAQVAEALAVLRDGVGSTIELSRAEAHKLGGGGAFDRAIAAPPDKLEEDFRSATRRLPPSDQRGGG